MSSTPQASHFPGTVVQTINNPDGTVSIIHIDTGPTGNSVVTLPDGTQATVVQAVTTQHQVTWVCCISYLLIYISKCNPSLYALFA